MTQVTLANLKNAFQDLLHQSESLSDSERDAFFQFMTEVVNGHDSDEESECKEHKHNHNHKHENCCEENSGLSPEKMAILEKHEEIVEFLKERVVPPFIPSAQKQIRFPSASHSFSEYNPENTIEVDAYMYTDEDIDNWVSEEKFTRWYCADCKSTNIKWLNMISHSMARPDLFLTFDMINSALKCEQIPTILIDVGSRIGAILWHAYFTMPTVSRMIGVEIEKTHVDIQREVIEKFSMNRDGRSVEIVHGDILEQVNLLSMYNERYILILHNVFEWFVNDDEAHQNAWKRLRQMVKKGSILITSPPILTSLTDAGMQKADLFIFEWLRVLHVIDVPGISEGDDSGNIVFYEVK